MMEQVCDEVSAELASLLPRHVLETLPVHPMIRSSPYSKDGPL